MAFAYNHTTLVGYLSRDPEVKYLAENLPKVYFTLAVNRGYKKEDGAKEADFIPVCLWGKTAEIGLQILKKGAPVLVSGRLQIRHYEKDKTKRFVTEVIADTFQLLEKKHAAEEPPYMPQLH